MNVNFALAIHWKTGNASGVRCFTDADPHQLKAYAERRVRRDLKLGEQDPIEGLHQVGEWYVYWPKALGEFPGADTLAQWEREYSKQEELGNKRAAAIVALKAQEEERLLAQALNHPDAPVAVKDYKAALAK